MTSLLARRPFVPRFFDDDTFDFPELFNGGHELMPSRLFNRSFFNEMTVPAVNIEDNTKSFDLELAVPGYKKDDLKVNVKDGVLTISSERKTEKDEQKKDYARREFSYSAFSRSFVLPENVDQENVKANFSDGILKLSIAKTKAVPEVKGREIKIA